MSGQKTRCGIVAIVGPPNAGKSTFLNRVVGQKIAIVSPKAQTTRTRTAGIVNKGETQIIFHDTPGLLPPRRTLEKAMMHAAEASADEADLVLFMVDAGQRDVMESLTLLARLPCRAPLWLVLNKVDTVKDKAQLLPLIERYKDQQSFAAIHMIAGGKGDGVDTLLDAIATAMPESPWHYGADDLTDVPSRILAAEITREQLYLQLGQELPYATTVVTDAWESFENGSAKISQTIFVEKDGQKAIVIGKGGTKLKAIGSAARKEMQALFGHAVHLSLFVKVKADWQEKAENLGG